MEADRVQLQQVLLNLIINAVEAMGADNEGSKELLVSTGKVEPSGALVAVRDTGPGLEAVMLEQVFESLLHDEADRFRTGSLNLPFDHRGAWRAPLGEYEPAARRHLSIYASLRSKHSIVIGTAEPKSVRAHVCMRNIGRFVALRCCRQNPFFGPSNQASARAPRHLSWWPRNQGLSFLIPKAYSAYARAMDWGCANHQYKS